MITDFGFASGILDYWILVSDWRNGSFAILLALSVIFVGYVRASGNEIVAGEVPMPLLGTDDAGAKPD
jgi:hypothetical protein